MEWILQRMYQPVDPAALGIARFLYGLIMVCDIFEERGLPYVMELWGDPSYCHFPLFNDLPILRLEYLYMVFLVMLISAIFISLGFLYRLSCFTFALSYWYIFLIDKTKWNNHSYLYGLLAILFFFTNGNHYWSVDSLLWPSIRNKAIPRWHQSIFKFQVFIVYFFAGIKKLDRDWVSGYSMIGLSREWVFHPFRMIMTNEQIDFFIVHLCGLILDMSVGFLMYFDPTRIVGFVMAYQFHLMNAFMFNIGMFSYACMALIPIFCRPDWPKKIFRLTPKTLQLFLPLTPSPLENTDCSPVTKAAESASEKKSNKRIKKNESNFTIRKLLAILFCLVYISIQVFLPWSHFISKGYNSWTQGLYGYSWDMMVHSWNTQHVVIKVVDGETQEKTFLKPGAFVSRHSRHRIFSHPDMMKQYAVCLAERIQTIPGVEMKEPQVYFDIWKSLNKRFQQRMVDPRVDLVSTEWDPFTPAPFLRPLLTELSPWRKTLANIKSVNKFQDNSTDIVFVADFPGLYLENFIAEEIQCNITVLLGSVIVEIDNKNFTVETNETLAVDGNTTHIVHTVGEGPSCYMYVYQNTSWSGMSEEEIIKSDPELERIKTQKEKWNNKTLTEKLWAFYGKKMQTWESGVYQLYYAFSLVFDIGPGENDGEIEKDEL